MHSQKVRAKTLPHIIINLITLPKSNFINLSVYLVTRIWCQQNQFNSTYIARYSTSIVMLPIHKPKAVKYLIVIVKSTIKSTHLNKENDWLCMCVCMCWRNGKFHFIGARMLAWINYCMWRCSQSEFAKTISSLSLHIFVFVCIQTQ